MTIETGFNGMTDYEQSPIPLFEHHLRVSIVTSAQVDMTDELRERIASAVWQVLPLAEDGDVFVEIKHG